MNNTEIISTESVSKQFPGVKALDNVSISCTKGEIHALVGENGAGKSTLIKLLGGVFNPDSGKIYLKGEEVAFKTPNDAQKAGINAVHQELVLVPYMSVAENILLGQETCNSIGLVRSKVVRRNAGQALSMINAALNTNELVVNLDATQQKLVQIAKSLVSNPDILIVDEPTAPLGRKETADFFKALQELKRKGTTVIYISHRLEEIFQIADRVTVLKDGRKIDTKVVGDTDEDSLIRMMIGRQLGDMFPQKSTRKKMEKILSVHHVERNTELYDVSFDLHRGEILGIAGLKGQGQDILLKAIFGVLPPHNGWIEIEGEKVNIKTPAESISYGMALITDKRGEEGLCPLLNVEQNLCLPTLNKRQYLGVINIKEEKSEVGRIIEDLRIQTPTFKKLVKFLSGGNQQKIIIGKWIIAKPKIILFIEPTLGIDVGTKAELYKLIHDMAEKLGLGVILVTSDMLELLGLCDRILVMYQGKISGEFESKSATEEKIMKAAVGRPAHQYEAS
ncbi:MAG: sugar ABC transporter ATP-binding protein [Spirochaetota bacterium]